MTIDDRFDAAKDDVKGKVKEGYGKAVGDEEKEAEGKFDQIKSDVKEGVADVKDRASDIVDKIRNDDKK